jgi:hypothetical protein
MTNRFEFLSGAGTEQPAALRRDVRVRVVNCSASGCLIEMARPVRVGMVGALRSTFGDRELEDVVRVVRCEPAEGNDDIYRVAVQFLVTAPPHPHSLRYVAAREAASMPAWSDTER